MRKFRPLKAEKGRQTQNGATMGLWCSLNWKFCADSGNGLLFFARPKLRPRSGLFRRARPLQSTTRSGLGLRLTKKFTSQDLKISSGLLHKIFSPALSDQVLASAVCSKVAAFAPPPLQGLCFSLSPLLPRSAGAAAVGAAEKREKRGRKREESRGPNWSQGEFHGVKVQSWAKPRLLGHRPSTRLGGA